VTNKNSLKQWNIFGISFFGNTKDVLLEEIDRWLASKTSIKWIATVNPEFIMNASKDRSFFDILQKTSLNVVDGIGLAWAAKYRMKRKVEVISGSDLLNDLCSLAEKKRYSVFFLGGWGNRSVLAAKNMKKVYPKLKIAGCYAGSSKDDESVNKLPKDRVDILFVAYGMKSQEEWIARNLKKLNVGLVIGLGRSFDYYSGYLKRAPILWRKMHLEWLYSLIREPKRWKRQLELPKFVLKVLFQDPNRC
jgi:N-acetylglucosaminyldiphosphoundecaprenol N-acetyl-beta-D-mannosaminyltransferase